MSVRVISMLLGPAELSGFCLIYVRDALWARLEGCRGVERRDLEKDYHHEAAQMLLVL